MSVTNHQSNHQAPDKRSAHMHTSAQTDSHTQTGKQASWEAHRNQRACGGEI